MKRLPGMFDPSDAWYSRCGRDDDIVVSTRVRLARNLANFPFPDKSSQDEKDRIQALVFDSFSKYDGDMPCRIVAAAAVNGLDELERLVLAERCMLPVCTDPALGQGGYVPVGIVVCNDGRLVCQVNNRDHVRIIGFSAGFSVDSVCNMCSSTDLMLQEYLQFAASYEFGFLTASLADSGSGMKMSVRTHLPALAVSGRITEETERLLSGGLIAAACFGAASDKGGAAGAYYDISSISACSGTEFDQVASFTARIMQLTEAERKARAEYRRMYPTVLKDVIYKAVAQIKFSRFMSFHEAIPILSYISWGLDAGLLTGAEFKDIGALLFRIRDAHVRFLDKVGSFSYEEDVREDSNLRADRLRCLLMQESLEAVRFVS